MEAEEYDLIATSYDIKDYIDDYSWRRRSACWFSLMKLCWYPISG